MPWFARLLLVPSLVALLALVALFLGSDSAYAHGDCSGTSSIIVDPQDAQNVIYGGVTDCTQESVEVDVLSLLWSFEIAFPSVVARFDDWDLAINFFDDRVEVSDDHGMDAGRCYVNVSGHAAADSHWRWLPPKWNQHFWSEISVAFWVCYDP